MKLKNIKYKVYFLFFIFIVLTFFLYKNFYNKNYSDKESSYSYKEEELVSTNTYEDFIAENKSLNKVGLEEEKNCVYEDVENFNFLEINQYVSEDTCKILTKNWQTATSKDLFELKYPNYFYHDEGYGGGSFDIKNKTYGNISLITHAGNVSQRKMSEKLCTSLRLGTISADPDDYSYFKDEKNQYLILGSHRFLIMKEESPAYWHFVLTNQNLKSETLPDLVNSDDFKCFVRSIKLLRD